MTYWKKHRLDATDHIEFAAVDTVIEKSSEDGINRKKVRGVFVLLSGCA